MKRGSGALVAIDGPKGAGKTTILPHIAAWLNRHGLSVLLTKEPTQHFTLDNEQRYTGIALARLLAADRRKHLAEIVEPGLATHDVVATDRYITSTIAFRLLDGVPIDDVWDLNRDFRLPDLNVLLLATPETLSQRRAHRVVDSRFERGDPRKEIEAHRRAHAFIEGQGTKTVVVENNDDGQPGQAAEAIAVAIMDVVGRRHD